MEHSMRCSDIFQGVLDLLAPPTCAGCELPWTAPERFCPACEPLLEPVSLPAWQPPSAHAALYVYGGPLADALRKAKYHGQSMLLKDLGKRLAGYAAPYMDRIDCVVPVPLHAKRLRTRGYNQSALLAAATAHALHVPLSTRWLKRVRDTKPQVELAHQERLSNVKNVFRAKKNFAGKRVLLIDDVRTTGSTLAEASLALQKAGVQQVFTLVLSRSDTSF